MVNCTHATPYATRNGDGTITLHWPDDEPDVALCTRELMASMVEHHSSLVSWLTEALNEWAWAAASATRGHDRIAEIRRSIGLPTGDPAPEPPNPVVTTAPSTEGEHPMFTETDLVEYVETFAVVFCDAAETGDDTSLSRVEIEDRPEALWRKMSQALNAAEKRRQEDMPTPAESLRWEASLLPAHSIVITGQVTVRGVPGLH
jgi:hypothetical protein